MTNRSKFGLPLVLANGIMKDRAIYMKIKNVINVMNNSKFKIQNSLFCFLLSAFCLFSSLPCSAQETNTLPPPQSLQKETPIKKKRPTFVVGGGLGAQFGIYNAVSVSPQAGVYIKPWLLALVSGQYSYMWRKNFYNSNIWGLGAALQPCIIKRIVIHVGYEFEQYNFQWLDGSPKQVADFHFAVLGGGYKQYMSQNVFFQALILFNIPLNQPTINNYIHGYYPFFRIGVGVDL